MRKKLAILICTAALFTGLAAGCGGSEKETSAPETKAAETQAETETAKAQDQSEEKAGGEAISDTSAAGWHIVVEEVEINKSLENVSVDLGYTGVETSDFVKEASEGTEFCLIKLKIEKEDSTEVIDWPSFKLTDADGNEYTRIEDEFITDLGMARMPGTALNFGSNEGWIAYEIKEGTTGLQISYPFEAEAYHCDLSSVQ